MAKESSQHKGHRQRMRARVEQYGLESLEPHEALEYVLYITNTRKDTNGLAHVLSWTGSETLPGCWMPPRRIC